MGDTLEIIIDLSRPQDQTVHVEINWTPKAHRQLLQLPAWTPGSYTIRDHVQHLHSLELRCDLKKIKTIRTAPNQWLAELNDLSSLKLNYFIETRNLTVRTGYLDPDLASLNLAALIMEIDGYRWRTHELEVVAPDHWHIYIPLVKKEKKWIACDFDSLIDSPIHAGKFIANYFKVLDYQHTLLLIGDPPNGWPENFIKDISRVCKACCDLMRTTPPSENNYQLVIQILDNGYGGLEHDNSSVLQFSWKTLSRPDGYRKLLQLIGHEYLHQWNVRRLRPIEFRPYDYSKAVVCESLWFAEGITSYFDLSISFISDISNSSTFLKDLGDEISKVLTTPGRMVQSLASSAEEAWVKLYKSTAVSPDSQISYYRLGTAIAFCLDVRLRNRNSSLAILLRKLWHSHGVNQRGFTRNDILTILNKIDSQLGVDLTNWLENKDCLPLHETVNMIGLKLHPIPSDLPFHGLSIKDEDGRLMINRVQVASPGRKAGLVPGDELIAVNNRRLACLSDLSILLSKYKSVPLLYARRGTIAETNLIPERGVLQWCLEKDPNPSASQIALRNKWLEIY